MVLYEWTTVDKWVKLVQYLTNNLCPYSREMDLSVNLNVDVVMKRVHNVYTVSSR